MASELAEAAAMRVALRLYLPQILEIFKACGEKLNVNAYTLYLMIGHKPGGDLENPEDHTIMMRSKLDKDKSIKMDQDPNKAKEDQDPGMRAIFPLAKAIIAERAEIWEISPYDTLLYLYLIPAKDADDENSLDLWIKEKRRKDAEGNYLKQREVRFE